MTKRLSSEESRRLLLENILGLEEREIEERKAEMRKRLPTYPGTSYLTKRAEMFDVQPWRFMTYLAHYCPELLEEAFNSYRSYDGNENVEIIKEHLREYLIMERLFDDLKKEQDSR